MQKSLSRICPALLALAVMALITGCTSPATPPPPAMAGTPSAAAPATNAPPEPDHASITVDARAPRVSVSLELYGIFFEEISHAGEGGLYAELVQNRDFEANTIPEGWHTDGTNTYTPRNWRAKQWFSNDLPAWYPVADGGAEAEIAQESAAPLNEKNPHSLRLAVKTLGQRAGVANDGFWGMNFQSNEWYDLTFYARVERTDTGRGLGLVIALESTDGKKVCSRVTFPEVSGPWRKYTVALHARQDEPAGRLVIALSEPGTIWLDTVSLFPRKTFKDHGMRLDLAQKLADLHPGFLRYPGGCVVEGASVESRFRWKDSIGDISQRKGGFDLWGYYNSYGLGFHEYMQLAEDLGAELMYVINSGQSCQGRRPEYVADADLHDYVQESLDALEYATGPATSTWGAKRAANGHPEPFKIKYVEIGNENNGTNYQKHYQVFYDAIKAAYPNIITIADTRMTNQPMEFVDDHFYVNPARFFNMANFYDTTNRSGPKIYVGEYAVNRGVGHGNLLGALSEAVFMMNMERNSDVVKMCSYAPLFENVNKRDWAVNLILLDSSRSVGRSSFEVQKLFGANRPDAVLNTEVIAPHAAVTNFQVKQIYALAGLDARSHELVLKVVNPTGSNVTAAITLKGMARRGDTVKVITLTGVDGDAENTLDHPGAVVPVESQTTLRGNEFANEFRANSLTVLRLPVNAE